MHLPEVEAGRWYFEDLYVNGRRAIRARSPNEFYYYVRGAAGPVANPATGKTETLPNRAFVADPKDIAPLAGLTKSQLGDAVIVAYFYWENSVSRIASVDPKTGTIVLAGDTACRCWVAGRVSDTTSRTSRRLSTRPASGSSIAAAICSIFPCPAKT